MTIDAKCAAKSKHLKGQSAMILIVCHIATDALSRCLGSIQPIRCISRVKAGVEINDKCENVISVQLWQIYPYRRQDDYGYSIRNE
jgi:hypothetical protein